MSTGWLAGTLLACCGCVAAEDAIPAWFSDAKGFCAELTKRSNGAGSPVPGRRPASVRFADYPARPVAPSRRDEAVISKYAWTDDAIFKREVRDAVSGGPDFAGRYAIVLWSCGTACANAVIADVVTGKNYETPFVGVIGGMDSGNTMQRRTDSSLLIVRGSLELTFGNSFSEGLPGVFYFQWIQNRLRLIGCDIPEGSGR